MLYGNVKRNLVLVIDIINSIKGENRKQQFDPNTFYIYPLYIIFLSTELSYGKIVILEGFISVYLLMIIKGAIALVFVLIFSLIVYIANKENNIFKGIGYLISNFIWLVIANIFSHFLENLFLWLIIDRFSPNYNPFAIIFQEVDFCIFDGVSKQLDFYWDFYVRIILYIISTIGVIIHNEIVVINICDLGSDTKYFLDKKVENEELFAKTDNPEILKRFETLEEMESINEESEEVINDERNNSSEN